MNCRYFACADCRKYVDAGYRWAAWLLEETGIVRIGESVSPERVLAATDYWEPPPEERSKWLVEQILPAVRGFISEHGQHALLYLEADDFAREDSKHKGYEEIPTG